ncbi:sensor histidine kinase [Dokdonella sp. MW10]|uniref:sensor histidine kinase n=1 Tax=Dokdonella sp. MW10 TaxID=2992926 RepID=UPI003F8157BC
MRLFSLEGKFAAAMLLAASVAALVGAWVGSMHDSVLIGTVAALAAGLVPSLLLARAFVRPIVALIRTLSGSVVAFRDGDFSFSIRNVRHDELGDLVEAHNALGAVLREQRQGLFQRELLLDTVVQNTPNALVLVEPGGHVVVANLAARALLNGGTSMNGLSFDAVLAEAPGELARVLAGGEDALFGVSIDGEDETFHLSQRTFKLQGRPHRMVMLRRMTRELSRAEVATWKKVIRVISHELNNSLAPIRSLAHSGRELARLGDTRRMGVVFDTIEDRASHLGGFIEGYAHFAKLPMPQPSDVEWGPFLQALGRHYTFTTVGEVPTDPGRFDRTQVEQLLINLVKNAHEASGDASTVELDVVARGREWRIEVRDRGPGMSDTVLAQALLPFYSTKRSGTGLGLALAREIAEAHGGRVQLANREGGGLAVTVVLPRAVPA